MKRKLYLAKFKIIAIITLIQSYVLWLLIYFGVDSINQNDAEKLIWIFSLTGVLISGIYLYLWRLRSGSWFSLFSIFLMFFIVFNFGQCVLWALGIHVSPEVGKGRIFGRTIRDTHVIIKTQLMFIICYIAINTGGLLGYTSNKMNTDAIRYYSDTDKKDKNKILFYTSLCIAFFSIPITLYKVVRDFVIVQAFSYHDLVYGDIISSSTIVNLGVILFFPSLMGILIGTSYKKTYRNFVYIIFGIYAVFSLLSGDRGEWITKLIILIWAENHYHKKFDKKKLILILCVGIIGSVFVDAIISLRNSDLSVSSVIDKAILGDDNVVISMLSEFGNSMQVNTILIQDNVEYPYGNSYLVALLTVASTAIANGIFHTKFVQLHTWFSSTYLGISTGADFTMIGEAILNVGQVFAPLVICFFGMLIMKISSFTDELENSPIWQCISISVFAVLLKAPRTTLWLCLNKIFYVVVVFSLLYLLFTSIFNKRSFNAGI